MPRPKTSAGILMYRIREKEPEILLLHPGGPYWENKDDGVWSIPKGEIADGETDLLEVAKREFKEETGFLIEGEFVSLGTVERKDGKIVHAWAIEGDIDASQITCNTIFIEWPPRSGKQLEIPECDRGEFCTLDVARKKIMPYQIGLLDAFEAIQNQRK